MSASAEGDMDAFEALIRRHQEHALQVAYRFLGDQSEAEDLVQQTFLKILEHASSYRRTARFRTYLDRVLANACIDYRRKRRPEPSDSLPPVEESALGPGGALEREQRVELVRRAIRNLPARQRMALVLHHYEGLSYMEVAAALDCSRRAIESLLVRAKRALREELKGLV